MAAVAATGTITVNNGLIAAEVGATINGEDSLAYRDLFNNVTASDLTDEINANEAINSLVSATSTGDVITITALTPGLAGNDITLSALGDGMVASGATLTGGLDAVAAPVIGAPTEGSTLGVYRPTVVGTGVAGSTITVYLDGVSIGTALASGFGIWTFNPTSNMAQGAHALKAKATVVPDTSASSTTINFTVTVVPVAPVIRTVSRSTYPVVKGTGVAGNTITVYLDDVETTTGTVAGGGTYSISLLANPASGEHSIYVTQTDAYGTSPHSAPHVFVMANAVAVTPSADADLMLLFAALEV